MEEEDVSNIQVDGYVSLGRIGPSEIGGCRNGRWREDSITAPFRELDGASYVCLYADLCAMDKSREI